MRITLHLSHIDVLALHFIANSQYPDIYELRPRATVAAVMSQMMYAAGEWAMANKHYGEILTWYQQGTPIFTYYCNRPEDTVNLNSVIH